MRRYQGLKRRVAAVTMAALMCLGSVTGCAKGGAVSAGGNTGAVGESTESEPVSAPADGAKMQAKWLTVDDGGVEKKLTSLVGDTLYWAEWNYNADEKKFENQKVSYMRAGREKHEIFANDDVMLREFFVNADETKICYLYRLDETMGVELDSLDKASGETTAVSTWEITDEKLLDELISNAVTDGVLDDNGTLWLLNSDNMLLKLSADGEYEAVQCTGDGLLTLDKAVYVYALEENKLILYSAEDMGMKAEYDFAANGIIGAGNSVNGGYVGRDEDTDIAVLGGNGSEFYVMCGDNVYTYTYDGTLKAGNSISLEKSGLDNRTVTQMGRCDNRYYMYADENDGGSFVVLVENLEDLKTKVELACMSNYEKDLSRYVSTYNKYSDEYYVEIKSYDFREERSAFDFDLIHGDAADMFLLNGVSLFTLMGTDSLEKLSPYYGASDAVSLDMLENSVKRACELNGGQYMIMNKFTVSGFLMKKEHAQQMENGVMSLDTMYDILMANPSMDICSYAYPREMLTNYFVNLFMPQTDMFIDWDNKTCSFDDGRFEKFITYLSEIGDSRKYNDIYGQYSQTSGNSGLAAKLSNDLCLYSSPQIITLSSYAMDFKDAILKICDLTGYPGDLGETYYIMSPEYMFGMNHNSQNKDGVWDFFEFIYSEQMQKTEGDFGGLSARSFSPLKQYNQELYDAALEGELDIQLTSSHYINEFTNESHEGAPVLDEADIEFIKNAVDSAYYNKDIENNDDILSIIREELGMFFAGDKSAKETAKIIQGRIELYLGE